MARAAYEGKPIETAANDAGLIAQTLQAGGFDVASARDLDEDSLRGSLRDFVEKARNVGPDGVAFIYFAGAGSSKATIIFCLSARRSRATPAFL